MHKGTYKLVGNIIYKIYIKLQYSIKNYNRWSEKYAEFCMSLIINIYFKKLFKYKEHCHHKITRNYINNDSGK